VESLAKKAADNGGVYLVPAFAGLGAPHWNQHARGTMVGMTRGTSAAHFARAALESIAFQTMDVLKAMEADSSAPIKELRVDGGGTVNDLLMQMQADALGVKVVRPAITETTAMGAAYLAGLAVGFWKDVAEIEKQWAEDKEFVPSPSGIQQSVVHWNKAVATAKYWAEIQ
jgi:glycerol kinase